MVKYWFALKSHIYVNLKGNSVLLYDTKYGDMIESSDNGVVSLVHQLYAPENLGVVPIDDRIQLIKHISEFIKTVVRKNMGDLLEVEKYPTKPVRLLPILNLQKDIAKYEGSPDSMLYFENDSGKYLLELNLYVNSSCDKSCLHCGAYSNQFRCCMADHTTDELSVENLDRLFAQIHYLPIRKINVLGGDISQYGYLNDLKRLAVSNSKELRLYCHYKNANKSLLTGWDEVNLIVTFPVDKRDLQNLSACVEKEHTKWHFIIESEEQCYSAEAFVKECEICVDDVEFIPFYFGANLNFFIKHVFIDKLDICANVHCMREIFRNQKLNANFFGSLYVLPNGEIKATLTTAVLGNIQNNCILDVIQKELFQNTAWRLVRDVQPCNDCIFQYLCPPLSKYEEVIGRNNLCLIRKTEER